jgi:hypothetical protein
MRCLILSFAWGIALTSLALAQSTQQIRAFKAGDKHEGSVIVKPLDDPANPYKDQYTDYDRWAVEHYNRHITLENHTEWQMGLDEAQGAPYMHDNYPHHPRWDPEHGLYRTYTTVDKEGFVVPHLWRDPTWEPPQALPTVRESVTDSRDGWAPDPAGFWSLGRIPAAILASQKHGWEVATAMSNAPVAEWMVAKNRDAVLLPDGGVIFITDARLTPDAKTGKWAMPATAPWSGVWSLRRGIAGRKC